MSEPGEPAARLAAAAVADVPQPRGSDAASADPHPQTVLPYLRALVQLFGSDLHCKVGSPPRVRIDGRLRRLQAPVLTQEDTESMLAEVLRGDLVQEFAATHEADLHPKSSEAFPVSGEGVLIEMVQAPPWVTERFCSDEQGARGIKLVAGARHGVNTALVGPFKAG